MIRRREGCFSRPPEEENLLRSESINEENTTIVIATIVMMRTGVRSTGLDATKRMRADMAEADAKTKIETTTRGAGTIAGNVRIAPRHRVHDLLRPADRGNRLLHTGGGDRTPQLTESGLGH